MRARGRVKGKVLKLPTEGARRRTILRRKLVVLVSVRFRPPTYIVATSLHGLTARGDRRSVPIVQSPLHDHRASNNAVFDAKVKATLDALVGQELRPLLPRSRPLAFLSLNQ